MSLRAKPGDRLIIKGHHVGEHDQDAEILRVLGDDDGPPFEVRWSEDGRVSRIYPGTDAVVEHFGPDGQPEFVPAPHP